MIIPLFLILDPIAKAARHFQAQNSPQTALFVAIPHASHLDFSIAYMVVDIELYFLSSTDQSSSTGVPRKPRVP